MPTFPASCDSCGLHRICFPARVAQNARPPDPELGIHRIRIPRGKVLYRTGERVDSFYMMRSGCIKETRDATKRPGTVVHFALPGELLSVHGTDGRVATTTSTAVDTSFICAVRWAAFHRLCSASPGVAVEFIRLVAKAATEARDLLSLIRDREALERVAGFLLNVSGRLAQRGARDREFRLGMNRDDIASYLGVRSETVSRSFTELRRRRLIRVRAKRVQIDNPAELRRLCGP